MMSRNGRRCWTTRGGESSPASPLSRIAYNREESHTVFRRSPPPSGGRGIERPAALHSAVIVLVGGWGEGSDRASITDERKSRVIGNDLLVYVPHLVLIVLSRVEERERERERERGGGE
jgi:hypothetical protein